MDVLIPTGLIDAPWIQKPSGWSANRLWVLCRMLDRDGSGITSFSKTEALKIFKCSPHTLRLYISNGLRLGFFWSVQNHNGQLTIVYCAAGRIMAQHKLENVGTMLEVNHHDLSSSSRLKLRCRQAMIQRLQVQSRYQARKHHQDQFDRYKAAMARYDAQASSLGYEAAKFRKAVPAPTFDHLEEDSVTKLLKKSSDQTAGGKCESRRIGRFRFMGENSLLFQ